MTPTEHTAKIPSPRTGIFAPLRARLHTQGTGAPSRPRLALAFLLALTAALALSAASALGARGHVFSTTFGSGPCTATILEPCAGKFNEPAGIAVNEATDDVYVVDKGNNRVEYFAFNETKQAYEYTGEFNGSGEDVLVEGIAAGSGGLPDEEATGRFNFPQAIAVDNDPASPSFGDVYVTDYHIVSGVSVVDKFTSTGEYVGQITGKTAEVQNAVFEGIAGVAVDTEGKVWVAGEPRGSAGAQVIAGFSNAQANVLEQPPCEANISGEAFREGLAVDSKDDLYARYSGVNHSGGAVEEFDAKCKPLNKELDSESSQVALNGVATETPSDDVYIDNNASVGRFAAGGGSLERFGAGHLAPCAEECEGGVAVDSVTGEVLVGDPSTDAVQVYALEPQAAPSVVGESVSEVTDDSATFDGELNPRSLPGEADTRYRFQYGLCAGAGGTESCATSAYELETPLVSLSPSFEVESVSAQAQGLLAGRTYHYRLLAENSISEKEGEGKPVQGSEETFATRGTGAFVLPDGRQWEMVSPPQKNGALIEPLSSPFNQGGQIQAAADGAAITYQLDAPSESEPQGYSNGVQVLSTRGTSSSGGWSSTDVAIPHRSSTGIPFGTGQEYRLFSEDLSHAVVQPFGAFEPSLSGEASEQTAFLRSDYLNGSVGEPCTSSCYRSLVTGKEGYANVPEGTVFGEQTEGECPSLLCGPKFVGASPDLGHVVLQSNVALTKGGGPGLYEWSTGRPAAQQLQFISEGEGEGGGAVGGAALGKGSQANDVRHAVSDDGTRVFWTAGASLETGGQLYVRDTVKGETLQIAPDAIFQTANSEGSSVFYIEGGDLYECALFQDAEEGGKLRCHTDLVPASVVLGSVLGTSEDGSFLYFVSNSAEPDGQPVPGAVHGGCARNLHFVAHTACDLYVRHGGQTRLVAVLSGEDTPDWDEVLPEKTARVSPDGQWLAFMSQRSLTGYDNRDAVSGKPDEEVYLYDEATGGLSCASCDPTGARPHGVEHGLGGGNMPLAGDDKGWEPSAWLAADVPAWQQSYTAETAVYQSRYLSNNGRLFFDSSDGLVPKDVNGVGDVYEYEPEGVPAGEHACTSQASSGSEVFKPGGSFKVEGRVVQEGAGCVGLISSGSSAQESGFLDASEEGSDVFFLTTAKLALKDTDNALDIYDAQECTTRAPCPPPAASVPEACNTEASCKPAPSPQPEIFGLSGSATFSGAGNLVPPPPPKKATKKTVKCKRGFVKNKKGKCVKSKHKKKSKAKKTSNGKGRA